jgi:hypothetical protein
MVSTPYSEYYTTGRGELQEKTPGKGKTKCKMWRVTDTLKGVVFGVLL